MPITVADMTFNEKVPRCQAVPRITMVSSCRYRKKTAEVERGIPRAFVRCRGMRFPTAGILVSSAHTQGAQAHPQKTRHQRKTAEGRDHAQPAGRAQCHGEERTAEE